MIFSEIYGSYYKAITEILKIAVSESGSASLKDIRPVIEKYAFAESLLAIEPAISEERWQVVRADGETAIENVPSRPLTLLERRWLKAISLDPRIKLFDVDFSWLDDVEPLFTQDDYYIFDKYDLILFLLNMIHKMRFYTPYLKILFFYLFHVSH